MQNGPDERDPLAIPRPEYPRPQLVRDAWLCLNGAWQFEIDAGDSGLERGLLERALADEITVPFCPESTLSGIDDQDYLNAVSALDEIPKWRHVAAKMSVDVPDPRLTSGIWEIATPDGEIRP